MKKPARVVFIGGIPTIGKTTLARKLGRMLKTDYLCTDLICRIIFNTTNKNQYPHIHFFRKQNPDKYYLKTSPQEFVMHFKKEAAEIFKGVQSIVKYNKAIHDCGIIIEGSAILPDLIKHLDNNTKISSIFLVAANKKEIYKNLLARGLWAKNKKTKIKEAECLWQLNKYIVDSAKKSHLQTIQAFPLKTLENRMALWIKRGNF